MIDQPTRTFSVRLRLALALLLSISLIVLAGSLRSDAKPASQIMAKARAAAKPHAAATSSLLHAFDANTEGNAPEYGLVQGPDGSLYGVTTQPSGNGNVGIVFKVNPDGTGFAVLHRFDGGYDGGTPGAKLLLDGGLLLGVCTIGGGDNEAGTLFAIDPTQVSATNNAAGFSVLHYFQATVEPFGGSFLQLVDNSTDGSQPNGTLFLAAEGSVYGTTYGPEANGSGGTIFRLQPDSSGHFSITAPNSQLYQFSGTYTTLYQFNGGVLGINPANGANPLGGVIQLSDGFLYGTTSQGGSSATIQGVNGATSSDPGDGTVYKIATDGTGFTILHSFTGGQVVGPNGISSVGDGQGPECDLIQGADGDLYGTTYEGGPGGSGTVFQIQPVAHVGFSASSPFGTIAAATENTGDLFAGGVIQASDGNLYGTTLTSGADGNGSVFQIAPNPSKGEFDAVPDPLTYGQTFPDPYTTIYTFLGLSNPQNVACPLIQGLDGRLYGDSLEGGQLTDGSDAGGTVFAISAGLPVPVAPLIVSSITGSLNPPQVTTAAQDAVLVVHGENFNGGDVVSIDGQNAPVTNRNLHVATDEQLTVTLTAPLSAGSHTVTVADIPADGTRVSTPLSFTVDLLSPQITQVTNVAGGAVTSIDTTLIISGNSFAAEDTVNLSSVYNGTTLTRTVNNGDQITLTLSQGLPPGGENFTVTHAAPDGRASNVYSLTVQAGPAPVVTSVTGTLSPPSVTTNDTNLLIHGTGFASTDTLVIAGLPSGDSVQFGAPTADGGNPGGEQIAATLSAPVPAGTYHVTVTHAAPDGRSSASFAFTVAAAPPPTVTSTAYTVTGGQGVLTVNGTGFVHGSTLAVVPDSSNVTLGGTLTAAYVSPTQITGTISHPLPAGVYTVTVSNPDNQSATGKAYVLALTGLSYSEATLQVTITGAGISPGANVAITSDASSTADPNHGFTVSPDGTTITFTLAHALPAGHLTFTVTNPDGQIGAADLYIASIASVQYTVTATGLQLIITGAGFDPQATVAVDNTALTVASRGGDTKLTATGNDVLAPGSHTVIVTNSDGGQATFALTASPPPVIAAKAATFITNSGGSSLLGITGTNIITSGYSADYPNFVVGATVDGTFEAATKIDTATNSAGVVITQLFIPVGASFGDGPHSIVVYNPDGRGSDGSAASPQARASNKAVTTHAASPHTSGTTANIYSSDQTSYVATVSPQNTNPILQLLADAGNFLKGLLSGIASGCRVFLTDLGNALAKGSTYVTAAGGGLLDGLIGKNGAGIVAQGGGNIVAQGGGNLIGQDGNGVVSNAEGSLIGQDGNGIRPASGNARPLAATASIEIYGALASLENDGSGNNSLQFQTLGASGAARPSAAAHDSSAQVLFGFSKSDEGAQGTAPNDFTVTGEDSNGNPLTLLEMRFTPGQPDQVLYEIPGLVLTPTNGTPAPAVMNPVPTINALSASPAGLQPASVGANGAPFTLTVNGTQFAEGATISFGGHTVPTTGNSGTTLTAQIPAALIHSAGSVPVIVTNPSPGGGDSAAATFTVGPQVGAAYLHTFAAGLQMIAVPENYSGVSLASAWDAPAGQLLDTWTGGPDYLTGTALPVPGQGAWVHPTANVNLFDAGTPSPITEPTSIPLHFGWNLIGNPYSANVMGSSLMVSDSQGAMHTLSQANSQGLVYTTLYTYPVGSTQYQAVGLLNSSLVAYQGYWMYAFQPCTLLVPSPGQ